MEGQESIIGAILDEEAEDFDTMDLEEGELVGLENELVGLDLQDNPLQNVGGDINSANQEADSKQNKRRKKKKKPRKKKGNQGPDEINIDRFVLDACRRLRERKTHMVYTAVGYLGVAALRDLIKEVDAIQTCGGQKIANGKRFRNGGGILWNILKTRDPNAYREIMKKTREFEDQQKTNFRWFLNDHNANAIQIVATVTSSISCSKCGCDVLFQLIYEAGHSLHSGTWLCHYLYLNQFRQQNKVQKKEVHPERVHPEPISENFLDHRPVEILEEKRAPVRDRIRVPVTYDDLLDVKGPETHTSA